MTNTVQASHQQLVGVLHGEGGTAQERTGEQRACNAGQAQAIYQVKSSACPTEKINKERECSTTRVSPKAPQEGNLARPRRGWTGKLHQECRPYHRKLELAMEAGDTLKTLAEKRNGHWETTHIQAQSPPKETGAELCTQRTPARTTEETSRRGCGRSCHGFEAVVLAGASTRQHSSLSKTILDVLKCLMSVVEVDTGLVLFRSLIAAAGTRTSSGSWSIFSSSSLQLNTATVADVVNQGGRN